ncbi:hypothetical protein A2U01_0082915, partial [Trifolium medium]|nr:hypothetical protein [Trifolium medium]
MPRHLPAPKKIRPYCSVYSIYFDDVTVNCIRVMSHEG